MDVSEYRKQYKEQLERAAGRPGRLRDVLDKSKSVPERLDALESVRGTKGQDVVGDIVNLVRNKDEDLELRISALDGVSSEVGEHHVLIDVTLALLADESEPPLLRRAAFRVLQQSSFRTILFQPKRPEYLAVLRGIVSDDDPQLRLLAIETLAVEKDEYVQRLLTEGLKDPPVALVPPEKAIEFLGYDLHGDHYPILREMVETSPNPAAKREAVRLLSADATSKDMLARLLRDKSEDDEIRTISAVALQSIAPAEFEAQAKQIAVDEDEDDDLRAVCISALDYFGDQESLNRDEEFNQQIDQLSSRARSAGELESAGGEPERSSGELERAADRFIKRRRQ
ncbi:MAG TPA: HEAT repeat domain-containing protein [Pyrinomonadaceae bacterium]|nr:HEAT repeat domain-containing protein [Pyrinomonadaceae bacterium]